MWETSITDNHFYFWVEYYNKKWEVTCETDVNEEIDVYEDHIRYENYCPWVWEDYYDFAYKVEWDKLFVKAINFENLHFGKNYEKTLYKFITNWKYNNDEMLKYFNDHQRLEHNWYDAHWKFEYRDYVKNTLNRHEFKQERNWSDHFSNTAKNWIMKQIKNKNFKKDK